MFRNAIVDSPFLGSAPDFVFDRIGGSDFRGDYSMTSTLRALVFSRMSQTDTIRFVYRETSLTKGEVDRNHQNIVLRHVTNVSKGCSFAANSIYLLNTCNYDNEGNTAVMDVAEKYFIGFSGGKFTRVEKLTEYYKKVFRILCFINTETKTTVIFTDNIDLRKFHFLQLAIPVMLPWYFPPETGVSEQEKAVLESFKERTPDNYLAAIAAIAEKYDFRSLMIKNQLGDFENRFLEQEAQSVQNSIDRYMSCVRDHEEEIDNLMCQCYDSNIKLMGIRAKIAEGDGTSEIVGYFIHNKNLSLVSVDRSRLTFNCKGYLTYFDEEGAKRYINNKNSMLYRASDRFSNEDIAMFSKALFLDQKIRMKFCASYTFDLTGSVRANSHAIYGTEFGDCTPNPHIDRYSCLGNHERAITGRLREHDYVGAIEQCISSCVSLNFADSTVIGEFVSRIFSNGRGVNIRCIELPDGKVVDPEGAIQWLKEQNEQKKAQEAAAETAGEGTNE